MVTIRVKGRLREELRRKFRPTEADKLEREAKTRREFTKEKTLAAARFQEEQERLDLEQQKDAITEMRKEARRLRFHRSKAGRTLAALREGQRKFRSFQEKKAEFTRKKNMTERRIRKQVEERVGLEDLRRWGRGEDNRYFGKHAPKWGSGGYGSKWKPKKKKKREKNPYFKRGLW